MTIVLLYAADGSESPRVAGLLADFGVNSLHFDFAERGFSFRLDGPLDMRFNPVRGYSINIHVRSACAADS